jgi:hypothetical protein
MLLVTFTALIDQRAGDSLWFSRMCDWICKKEALRDNADSPCMNNGDSLNDAPRANIGSKAARSCRDPTARSRVTSAWDFSSCRSILSRLNEHLTGWRSFADPASLGHNGKMKMKVPRCRHNLQKQVRPSVRARCARKRALFACIAKVCRISVDRYLPDRDVDASYNLEAAKDVHERPSTLHASRTTRNIGSERSITLPSCLSCR